MIQPYNIWQDPSKVLPKKVNIDGVTLTLKWTEHFNVREIQRKKGGIALVMQSLQKAGEILDYPAGRHIWIVNLENDISFLVCIRISGKCKYVLEMITFLNKIVEYTRETDIIVNV